MKTLLTMKTFFKKNAVLYYNPYISEQFHLIQQIFIEGLLYSML